MKSKDTDLEAIDRCSENANERNGFNLKYISIATVHLTQTSDFTQSTQSKSKSHRNETEHSIYDDRTHYGWIRKLFIILLCSSGFSSISVCMICVYFPSIVIISWASISFRWALHIFSQFSQFQMKCSWTVQHLLLGIFRSFLIHNFFY